MAIVNKFICQFDTHVLDELKIRITNTQWPPDFDEGSWEDGCDPKYLKSLCEYWVDQFSWQEVEKTINSYPNFIATIDTVPIHFIHLKAKNGHRTPILLTHGWPGSFLEMLKMIPILHDAGFDIVVPSLPGFGFSGCKSYSNAGVADLWNNLMAATGYTRYFAHGGDIGAGVNTWLALKFPDRVSAMHLNYIPGSYKPYISDEYPLSDEEKSSLNQKAQWSIVEGAYSHQHSTKPSTLGFGLADSPVGLCAWIIEKYYGWSDCKGDIENSFTKDELLANVSLYWLTRTIRSSISMYKKNSDTPLIFQKGGFVKVPTAYAKFPKEIHSPPKSYIDRGYNIERWTEFEQGGHFAALEQPALLSQDIIAFFGSKD